MTDPQSSEIAKSIWDATLSAVQRAIFLLATILAFAAIAVPGAAPSSSSPAGAKADHITVRLRYKNGAWLKVLSLPLNRHNLKAFKVCGVWGGETDEAAYAKAVQLCRG